MLGVTAPNPLTLMNRVKLVVCTGTGAPRTYPQKPLFCTGRRLIRPTGNFFLAPDISSPCDRISADGSFRQPF